MIGPLRCTIVLFVLLTLVCPLPGQQEDTKETRRSELLFGTHALRRIVHDHKFTALESFADLDDDPSRTLLIILGDLNELRKVPRGVAAFVRNGGALLAASDRHVDDVNARNQLTAISGVTIVGEVLRSATDHSCYQREHVCPQILPVVGHQPPLLPEHLRVYTNVPSWLEDVGNGPRGVRPLAVFPRGSVVWERIPLWEPNIVRYLFAVAGDVGDGRVLVLADHSIFINQMMLPTTTNNVEFSDHAIRWLKGDNQERDQVLFVEDGTIRTRLDIPLKSVSIPPEEALKLLFAKRNEILVEAENILARAEDSNAFNRKLFDILYDLRWPPERIVQALLLVVTLVAILLLIYRLGIRARFRHETTVPLLAPTLARNLPADPLVEQRQQALLQQGNLWEPTALLVRRWFARMGLEAKPGQVPNFDVEGGWFRRWRILSRLKRLWQLATGQTPRRVTPAELWGLQRELDDLRASWERGTWRVPSSGAA